MLSFQNSVFRYSVPVYRCPRKRRGVLFLMATPDDTLKNPPQLSEKHTTLRNFVLQQLHRTWALLPDFRTKWKFMKFFVTIVLESHIFALKNIKLGIRLFIQNASSDSHFIKDVVYVKSKAGESLRQRLNIFLPVRYENSPTPSHPPHPVLIFIHGGAWATGDKNEYSIFGRFFAEHGVITVIPNYTLYPDGNIENQIEDVQHVISWVFEHVPNQFQGDRDNVIVMGHSAGAHIAMLSLMNRAQNYAKCQQSSRELGGNTNFYHHIQLPKIFIGSAGVYNIRAHYLFESWRGVSEFSPMQPAMMGRDNFERFSPACQFPEISKTLLKIDRNRDVGEDVKIRVKLKGSIIASRCGIQDDDVFRVPAMHFPNVFLQASGFDATVPFHSSVEFKRILDSCGIESKLLLYDGVEHSDFVIDYMRANDRDCRNRLFVPKDMCGQEWIHDDWWDPQFVLHVRDVLTIIWSVHENCTSPHQEPCKRFQTSSSF